MATCRDAFFFPTSFTVAPQIGEVQKPLVFRLLMAYLVCIWGAAPRSPCGRKGPPPLWARLRSQLLILRQRRWPPTASSAYRLQTFICMSVCDCARARVCVYEQQVSFHQKKGGSPLPAASYFSHRSSWPINLGSQIPSKWCAPHHCF